MGNVGLFVRMEAKPGREEAVAQFLAGALELVDAEPATRTWFALRLGPTTFAIVDTFSDEAGRQAHLSGKVAEALFAQSAELFTQAPTIEEADVLAAKLPG